MTASRTAWPEYLTAYHSRRPGITEAAFERARDSHHGTAHDWLLAPLAGPGDVLDVACGNGALQPRLRDATSYLGVDLSEAELTAARDLGRGPVTRGDARALPAPDASFDTVVSSMGLMLVRPLHEAIDEMARVLCLGGTAAFLLPARMRPLLADLRPLAALTLHLRGPGSMPQRVGRRRLTALLERAGMVTDDVATHRFGFPLETADDARLAVESLYTPGRAPSQLAAAEAALSGLARPGRQLPLPLLRFVARKVR